MFINRQRQLPHEDWKDPRLVVLPTAVRHLATALRMMADPAGRGQLHPFLIRSLAWPTPEEPSGWWPTTEEIEDFMLQLDAAGWLTIYPNPDSQTGGDLFQILARWPHVSREGESHLPPAPPRQNPSGRFPGSGESGRERGGAGEWAGERARASAGEGLSGAPNVASQPSSGLGGLRLPPSSFCSVHVGGPPEGVDCRDCGTARLRHQRYAVLRATRQQALAEGGVLASMALAAIDTEMRALQDAAAAALLRSTATCEDDEPTEFIDDEGRIDHT